MDNNASLAQPAGTSGGIPNHDDSAPVPRRPPPPIARDGSYNRSTTYPPGQDNRSDLVLRGPLPTTPSSEFLSDRRHNPILNTPIKPSSSMVAASLASLREPNRLSAPSSNSFNGVRATGRRAELPNYSEVSGRGTSSASDSAGSSSNSVTKKGLSKTTPSKNPASVLQTLRDILCPNDMSQGVYEPNKRREFDRDPDPADAHHLNLDSRRPSTDISSLGSPNKQAPATNVAKTYDPRSRSPTIDGIKREPSPLPADHHPRQIREGTKLYTPLPDNLRRTHYNYAQNRKEWLRIEHDKLKNAGLVPTRAFFREDGISIDWMSTVPVMSDTLLAAPAVTEKPNKVQVVECPPLPSPSSAITSVGTQVAKPDTATQPPKSSHLNRISHGIESSDTVENLDIEVRNFLIKYVQMFDKDRASLASAYARTGTFSCQIHRPASCHSSSASVTSLFSTIECGWKQGRLDVMTALVSIDPRFKFIPGSVGVDFAVDSTWLGPSSGLFLATCYAQLDSGRDKVGVDMAFVLRDKDEDEEDRVLDGLWSPLVAVAHQMTFRDLNNFLFL